MIQEPNLEDFGATASPNHPCIFAGERIGIIMTGGDVDFQRIPPLVRGG